MLANLKNMKGIFQMLNLKNNKKFYDTVIDEFVKKGVE